MVLISPGWIHRLLVCTTFLVLFFWSAVTPAKEPISPLPLTLSLDEAKVRLGEKLFGDPRLSKSGIMACSNCHILARGGVDGLPKSIGNGGNLDLTNAPTVFNSVFNFRQTWRGEFRTLEQQAEADLRNPNHANTTWEELLPKLRGDSDYRERFRASYDGITREAVLDAIATFERSLITPNARFDRYLRGDKNAISALEKHGYHLFKAYGCIACHQGQNVGGNLFQKMGIVNPFFDPARPLTKGDLGRFNVTQDVTDKNVFRVPSLRNVAVTAPYFHDGSAQTLSDAVTTMAQVQLGVELPPKDRDAIIAFLRSLTGEYRGRLLDAPPEAAK